MDDKVNFLEKECNSLRRKIEDHDDEMRNMRRKIASLQVRISNFLINSISEKERIIYVKRKTVDSKVAKRLSISCSIRA